VGDDFFLELILFLPVCEFFYEILWLILTLISSSVSLRGSGEVGATIKIPRMLAKPCMGGFFLRSFVCFYVLYCGFSECIQTPPCWKYR